MIGQHTGFKSLMMLKYGAKYFVLNVQTLKSTFNCDIHIKKFHLGKYIIIYRVTVDRLVHSAVLGMWCIKHTM